jgi:hypothetical protein
MTPKDIINEIEHTMGRQSQTYLIRLMNHALLDMGAKKKAYTVSSTTDLYYKKRWYELSDQMIDITKVEILDTNDRYVMIPKLADSHRLLREDSDLTDETLT